MANEPPSHMKLVDRLRLAQEIARLVRARLPLEKALSQLANQSSGAMSQAIHTVNDRLQAGHSLADSLAHGTDQPTHMLMASIELGESSGALDQALDGWATYHLTQQRLHRRLSSALVYPWLLVIVALVSILVSAWRLLPQYQQAFAQLAEVRPQWLGALETIERYYGLIAMMIIACTLVALWLTLGNRRGVDRYGLPRNTALRHLFYAQIAKMSVLGVRSGLPVQMWLARAAQSVGLAPDQPVEDLLASPAFSQRVGRETNGVLLGLQAGQLSPAESESLLNAIGDSATMQAELSVDQQVHRLPMLTSIIVGIVAIATYLGLIYLPWVALFYYIAKPA